MSELAPRLLAWQRRHGRHDLPWQHPRSPYRVWVAEVMLQQTQVVTVMGYFQRFVAALPDLPSLARADDDTVMALWSGLGYYRRARHLQRTARICAQQHNGRLPRDFDALLALPGIGRSTAGAILAQAHGQRRAILDGNAKRVLARHFAVRGWPGQAATARQLWALAEANTPSGNVADYTQAIMDLGATVCTRRKPRCGHCPLAASCQALELGLTEALPTSRPRKPRPEKHLCMVVLRDRRGRVLLERRGRHGVWPGLWSLPEAADADAAARLAGQLARAPGAGRALAPLRHDFSHYRLHIQPLLWSPVAAAAQVRDTDDRHWFAASELAQAGLPAPVRRLLERA